MNVPPSAHSGDQTTVAAQMVATRSHHPLLGEVT
jgi:hypothetical protein